MLVIRNNTTSKNIAARVIAVLIMIVLAMGLSGCSLKPAENQTLNIDGIQVHIESNGKISQDKADEFIEAVKNQPDYLKKNCENIYLMTNKDLVNKGNEISRNDGMEEDNSNDNFAYKKDIFINYTTIELQNTISHELWHVYDGKDCGYQYEYTRSAQQDFQNLYNNGTNTLTDYAATDSTEFFAEAGAMYVSSPNELKEANMDVYNYFEALPKE